MKTFNIGFSKNTKGKIFSRLLQWYMRKNYSHVYFKFGNNILHSEIKNGVNYWDQQKFDKDNTTTMLYTLSIEDSVYIDVRENLNHHVGHKYAFMQNLGIVIVDILQKLGLKTKNPFRDGDNCSELVFHTLQKIHPELERRYSPNSIRPDHIQGILNKYGYKRIM